MSAWGVRLTFCVKAMGWSDSWWQEGRGPDHIGPHSRVPAPPGFPWGNDLHDQGQESDTNELCSLLYTFWHYFQGPFAVLYLSPNHILAPNVEKLIWTIFCPDQFTHILPPSIWCITTPRYYCQRTAFILTNQKCYGKSLTKVNLPKVVAHLATACLYQGGGYIWPRVSLPKVVTHLGHEISLLGGLSDQRSACPK